MADPEDREPRPAPPPAEGSASGSTTDEAPAVREADLRIGVYQVMGLLGAGGMGDVFLAYDSRLRRRVAIKRVRRDAATSERARARLRREAAAAATLNHPAVVHVYDILEEPDGEAIVMEYVEGRTLAGLRAQGPLPVRQTVGLGRQVAEGLAAAHALGLIHRDLKTQNVMVTPSGQAKILDFGLAKQLTPPPDDDTLTADGAVIGTLRSMSPEQAEGRDLDARSDLFSLGVLLYEIGTGRVPFRGDSPTQTLRQVIAEQPPPAGELNPELPVPLVQVIHQLLEKDPDRRPQSAAEVAARLREIERGLDPAGPGLTSPSATLTVAGRFTRRWFLRWPAVTAAAVAALALATGMARLWRPGGVRLVGVLVEPSKIALESSGDRTAFAAFALKDAILRALVGLEGIEAMERDDLPSGLLSVQDAARAVAADEILAAAIACEGQWCHVSLRRHRGRDAQLLGEPVTFDVSSDPESSLSNAVNLHVRKMFPDFRPRSEKQRFEASQADYQRYLTLQRRSEAGEVLAGPELDALEEILRTSPDLTEAFILAAAAARALPDGPRAERILRAAESRHPDDPRLVYSRFLFDLELGRLGDAEAAFADLEKRSPGSIRTLRAQGMLLARQGKLQEAAEVRERLVRERPSWRNLWYVAHVEIDLGEEAPARRHLDQLLRISPGNPRGLAEMALLEWQMGDPARAARIYEDLLRTKVTRRNLSNLGWSHLLAGQYAASANAYRRALEMEPGSLLTLLNLGIAEEGGGDALSAGRRYRDVLDRLARRDPQGALTASEKLIKAQALARLGQAQEAVDLTHEALRDGDQDPQVLFQAGIIYALCGDRNNAITYLAEARKRGLSRSWLGIPGLEALRASPAFGKL